jgi:2-methylene-furan-3-one reductase
VQVVKEGSALLVLTGAVEPPGARFVVTSRGKNLAKLTPYLESGKVKVVIHPKGLFKFSELVEANHIHNFIYNTQVKSPPCHF